MSKKTTPTPTIEELARLKPNAKGGLYLIGGDQIAFRYMPRLGKHGVHCEGDAELFESEADALAAAKKFLGQIREGIVKKIAPWA